MTISIKIRITPHHTSSQLTYSSCGLTLLTLTLFSSEYSEDDQRFLPLARVRVRGRGAASVSGPPREACWVVSRPLLPRRTRGAIATSVSGIPLSPRIDRRGACRIARAPAHPPGSRELLYALYV